MAGRPTRSPGELPYREDISAGRYALRVSDHALREGHKEGVRGKDIIYIVMTGEVVERYAERRRILVAGNYRSTSLPDHVVCDYSDLDELVIATVYIPLREHWSSFRQRRRSAH